LRNRIEEAMENMSIDKLKEELKKVEKKKLEIANATIKIKTSIVRKKKQLKVYETAEERDIDDAITNAR
jgi:hypothetical protein